MSIAEVLAHAAAHPRPFRYEELRRGASPRAIEAAVARGQLSRVLPDLYAAALHAESWAVRSSAACGWMPAGGALSGRGALAEHGLLPDVTDVVDLVVPRGSHRAGPEWMRVVSQTNPYRTEMNARGLTLAEPALALIHAFSREPARSRSHVVYSACARGLDPGDVRAMLDRLPRVRGRPRLQRILDLAAAGVESFLEERADASVLTGARLGGMVKQHRLTVEGQTFRTDAYDPVTRTAFEFDGDAWHSAAGQRLRDLRRDALLASRGILTVRFSYRDVMDRPAWCRALALSTLEARSA